MGIVHPGSRGLHGRLRRLHDFDRDKDTIGASGRGLIAIFSNSFSHVLLNPILQVFGSDKMFSKPASSLESRIRDIWAYIGYAQISRRQR